MKYVPSFHERTTRWFSMTRGHFDSCTQQFVGWQSPNMEMGTNHFRRLSFPPFTPDCSFLGAPSSRVLKKLTKNATRALQVVLSVPFAEPFDEAGRTPLEWDPLRKAFLGSNHVHKVIEALERVPRNGVLRWVLNITRSMLESTGLFRWRLLMVEGHDWELTRRLDSVYDEKGQMEDEKGSV